MSWIREDRGAVMVEYALVVVFIAAAAFLAVQAFGGTVLNLFQSAVDVTP